MLFADIARSTELLVAGRNPFDSFHLHTAIFDRMKAAVQLYQGTIVQKRGDGVKAVFGAPIAHEDHALRACYAALRMQEFIFEYAKELSRTEGFTFQMRVGIDSGEVVAGTPSGDMADFDVNGPPVNIAARMEESALPGSILITAQTFHFIKGHLETRQLTPVMPKGLETPVETYELLQRSSVRTRFQVASDRGLSRFVGRQAEMSRLRKAREEVIGGRGQLITIEGAPGVGKSRLIREFVRDTPKNNWRVLEMLTVSASFGSELTHHPIAGFLRNYFGVQTTEDALEMREKVKAKLLKLGQRFQALHSTILSLLERPGVEAHSPGVTSQRRGQSVLEAVRQLLFREGELQPLLVIVEDLHAVDPDTLALVTGLADGLTSARVLFLASYRPEFKPSWRSNPTSNQFRVEPLDVLQSQELLDVLAKGDETLEPLKRLLIERTAGNPFFLEESIRALVENGTLIGAAGRYTVAKSLEELNVPATVESLLSSRIDRLHPDDKRLLLTSAVVGYHVPFGVLEKVTALTPASLHQALERLQTSDFLKEKETDLYPNIEYSFRHALIHEVAYWNQSPDRRRFLHTATLNVGEKQFETQLVEKSAWLAFHAVQGQQWAQAVRHSQMAAKHEVKRSASRNAIRHLDNALAAVEYFSAEERDSIKVELLIELRHARTPLGQVREALDNLATAEELVTLLEDRQRLARIISFKANCLLIQARYEEALVTGERALTISQAERLRPIEIATRIYMARARLARGECHMASAMARTAVQALSEIADDDFLGLPVLPSAYARSVLAAALAETGEFGEAIANASDACRRAAATRQPDSIMWADWSRGLVALFQGASDEAMKIFESLYDLCRTHDLDAYSSRALAGLGCAKARLGQVKEGLHLLERAVAMDDHAQPLTTRSFALNARAEAYFLAGETTKAIDACNRALEVSHAHGERGAEAYAHFLLGHMQNINEGKLDSSSSSLRIATSIALKSKLRPLLAHCYLALAELERKRGHTEQAHTHLASGHEMLNALGMKQWLRIDIQAISATNPRHST